MADPTQPPQITAGGHSLPNSQNLLEDEAPPAVTNSDTYCGRFRLNPRFVTTTSITARPLVSVPINMMALCAQVQILLHGAYVQWSKLRALYSGNQDQITTSIEEGCDELAKAFVLMIYNHLRYKCSVHDSQNQGIYRNRCYLDSYYELPSGIATLVELFGFARPDQNHFNETYLHRWDHEHHGENEFGLNTARLNSHLLDGFMAQLINAGVPVRRVDKYCAPRNLWDSLLVIDRTGGHDVFTTYTNTNYVLPKDVFYAIGLCGASSLIANRSIQFYPPRLSIHAVQRTTAAIKQSAPDEATDAENNAMDVINVNAHADDAALRVCGTLINMHITGTQRVQTGVNINNNNAPVYEERIFLYGRGGAQQAMTIDCVARGVTNEEVLGFYRALFRHG